MLLLLQCECVILYRLLNRRRRWWRWVLPWLHSSSSRSPAAHLANDGGEDAEQHAEDGQTVDQRPHQSGNEARGHHSRSGEAELTSGMEREGRSKGECGS